MMMGGKAPMEITSVFDKSADGLPDRSKDRDRDRGPDLEI